MNSEYVEESCRETEDTKKHYISEDTSAVNAKSTRPLAHSLVQDIYIGHAQSGIINTNQI